MIEDDTIIWSIFAREDLEHPRLGDGLAKGKLCGSALCLGSTVHAIERFISLFYGMQGPKDKPYELSVFNLNGGRSIMTLVRSV